MRDRRSQKEKGETGEGSERVPERNKRDVEFKTTGVRRREERDI